MASIILKESNLFSYEHNLNTNQIEETIEISQTNLDIFDLLIKNQIFFNKNEIYLFAILNYLEKYINPKPKQSKSKPINIIKFKQNLSSLNLGLVMKTYNFSTKNLNHINGHLDPFYKYFAEKSRFVLFKYLAKYLKLTIPLEKISPKPKPQKMEYVEIKIDGEVKRFKIPIKKE